MADKSAPRTKAQADRDARLKAALKANLGRRKAQARARTDKSDDADNAGDPPKEQDNG